MNSLASTFLSLVALFGSIAAAILVDPMEHLDESFLVAEVVAASPVKTVGETPAAKAAAAAIAPAAVPVQTPAARGPYSAASPLLAPATAAAVAAGLVTIPVVRDTATREETAALSAKRVDAVVAPVARVRPRQTKVASVAATKVQASAPKDVPATRVAGKIMEKPYALGAGNVVPPEPATAATGKTGNVCAAGQTFDSKKKSCIKATNVAKASPFRTVPNDPPAKPAKR